MSPAGDPSARHAHPRPLALYLRDHLTGATAGLELFERAARARRGTPAGADLARLVREIGEDRETYKALMATLGVQVSLPKVVLAWFGEKVTRLKSNGRLLRRSPLSDLVELEVMYLGVAGKEAGWHTLRIVAESDDRLDVDRLDELVARARRQQDTLERLRQEEARRLFAPARATATAPSMASGSPGPAAG